MLEASGFSQTAVKVVSRRRCLFVDPGPSTQRLVGNELGPRCPRFTSRCHPFTRNATAVCNCHRISLFGMVRHSSWLGGEGVVGAEQCHCCFSLHVEPWARIGGIGLEFCAFPPCQPNGWRANGEQDGGQASKEVSAAAGGWPVAWMGTVSVGMKQQVPLSNILHARCWVMELAS